jgi:hypothetical protein
MERQSQPILDTPAIMELDQVHQVLHTALQHFGNDPALRRAFIHGMGAIDERIGRQPDVPPNRQNRRRGGPR